MFGSSEAPVKIVQFSDFQCPFCAAATATVYTLMKEYEGKIALVWKDFPLPTHPMAQRAALAAACAGRQGEFWEYHDYLFDHQETLSEETLTAAAKKVGVNLPVFETCMQGALPSQQISANFNEGVQLGIDQVPYFFIGEHRVAGAADAALFKDIIDRELKKVMK